MSEPLKVVQLKTHGSKVSEHLRKLADEIDARGKPVNVCLVAIEYDPEMKPEIRWFGAQGSAAYVLGMLQAASYSMWTG